MIHGERKNNPHEDSRRASADILRKDLSEGNTFRKFESSSNMGCFLSCRDVLDGSVITDPSKLYPYVHLLIIDTVQILNQLLVLGVEIKIFGIVQQIEEGRKTSVGLDGIRLVLL